MTKARSTHQTSAALSTFIVQCGNLRAKSIKIWTNSCSVDEILSGDKIMIRSKSGTSRKVVVPSVKKAGMEINNNSGGGEEVHMTLLGSRKWKPPRKPSSFSNGEVAEFGSLKTPAADPKFKTLDQFTCFSDIIQDRLSNPEKRRARTTLAILPKRKSSLLKVVDRVWKNSDICKTNKTDHMLVEVEWYTYRGWHDKEPEKDLWI